MTTNYDLSKIRSLLIEGFSEAELRNFCFDTPEFRPVHHELADLAGRAAIVRHLLEFAERRELFDSLLAWAKVNNLAKYARYQPYQSLPDKLTLAHPIHLDLVRIPAGEFLMGSDPVKDEYAGDAEQPQHRVYISEFYIGKYPVTNEQYAVFVKATKYKVPGHWEKDKIPPGQENHPVVMVAWEDTTAFCEWLSQETARTFRLPTETEWEKAARGTDGRIYPWGNQWDKSRLNGTGWKSRGTTPVGQYSPEGDSPYGSVDMAGNVWECCSDWSDMQAYQRRTKSNLKDPQGSKQSNYRVIRGGSFGSNEGLTRCACRNWCDPDNKDLNLGFRVVGGGPFPSESLSH